MLCLMLWNDQSDIWANNRKCLQNKLVKPAYITLPDEMENIYIYMCVYLYIYIFLTIFQILYTP